MQIYLNVFLDSRQKTIFWQFRKKFIEVFTQLIKRTRKKFVRLRKKERTEDALALEGEEGRDEQRNATGSSKYAKIRRCPNGGTQ